jgi:hypothetical protein
MQLTTTNNTANDIYNILIDINGHNAWTLNMDYFTMLYEDRNFWSVRSPKNLSSKSFKSYVEFAMYEVPWGLGWDRDIIKAHCKIPTYIWQEYEEQINPLKTYGGDKVNFEVDISTSNIKGGTSRQYQIQRLKRDSPDIATKVINRELSAKQGMEMAGLKDKTVVVKCKAEDFLIKAINNLEINQLEKLNYELQIFINNFNNERK